MAYPWPYALRAWSSRMAITVHGTASAGPYLSLSATLPQHDDLWDNMQADGDDLRVTNYAGTVVDFSNDAPDTSARTIANFLVEVTNASSATTDYLYWMYWGNSAATNAEGTVTNTNLANHDFGYGDPDPARTVQCVPEPPGATLPSQRVSKKSTEGMHLWFDLTPLLSDGPGIGGRPSSRVMVSVIDWDGTTGTGMYSAEATRQSTFTSQADSRFIESNGRLYYGIWLSSGVGTSGTDYAVKLRGTAVDTAGQVGSWGFEYRALVQVRDPFP